MPGEQDDGLLVVAEVAALTGVAARTLHEWASRRDAGLPSPGPVHIRFSPRHRRWRRTDVLAWIDASRVA